MISVVKLCVALAGSILIYALWYLWKFGQWCPAMWHGTAPPLIIFVGFALIIKILNQLLPNDTET